MSFSNIRDFSVCFGLLFVSCMFVGCERKEKVLDIETRRGSLEIERSKDSGDVDIKIDDK